MAFNFRKKTLLHFRLSLLYKKSNMAISSMRRSVSSPDETPRRGLDKLLSGNETVLNA